MTVMADQAGTSNVDHAVEVAATFSTNEHGRLATFDADHIARHDPARVLAECAAKRAIVEEHQPVDYTSMGMESPNACHICGIDAGMGEWEWLRDSWPCPTLRALAAVYADHADYRDEWRP
jgi:hypothetical protein